VNATDYKAVIYRARFYCDQATVAP